jgi:hypothetical protein
MHRSISRIGLFTLVLVTAAQAQTTGTGGTGTTPTSPLDRTPSQNLDAYRQQSPGTAVRAAIARHNGFLDDTIRARRSGGGSQQPATPTTPTTPTTGGDALGGLLGSLGGQLGDLSGLLGGLTGASGASGGAGGSNLGGLNVPAGFPPELLAQIQQVLAQGGSGQNARSLDTAADGVTPKLQPQAQTQQPQPTTAQPSFRVRLLNSLMTTFFTALTVAFSSPQFSDMISTALSDVFLPPADSAADGASGNGNDNGDGSGDGGSIDDVDDGGNSDEEPVVIQTPVGGLRPAWNLTAA